MAKLEFNASVLFVNNISLSKEFYTRVLNREIEHDFGNNVMLKGGIGLWQIRENHVVVSGCDDTKTKSNRTELYFETTDIAQEYKRLTLENVSFLHQLLEEPWGQLTVRFFDSDHHLIEIGESLQTFVRRMYNEGLTMNEVAEKSGIPISNVKELIG